MSVRAQLLTIIYRRMLRKVHGKSVINPADIRIYVSSFSPFRCRGSLRRHFFTAANNVHHHATSNGDRGMILEKYTFFNITANRKSVNYKAAHIMVREANVGAMHVKRIGTDVNNDTVLFTLAARRVAQ